MKQIDRGRVAVALALILLGGWFLAVQFVPQLQEFSLNDRTWPLIFVVIGAVFAVVGLVTWKPEMMVPACIIGGLGGLLYYQNTTNDWASWSYAWTLIIGFVGVGIFLSNALQGKFREALVGGGWPIVVSAFLFLIFGEFLGGIHLFGTYWPVLLIALGVIALARAVFVR